MGMLFGCVSKPKLTFTFVMAIFQSQVSFKGSWVSPFFRDWNVCVLCWVIVLLPSDLLFTNTKAFIFTLVFSTIIIVFLKRLAYLVELLASAWLVVANLLSMGVPCFAFKDRT